MPNIKKSVNRKNEFLEVAQALFSEKGFESTSVDDIVKRMGVAKGLFYYYFDSKDELMKIIMERLLDEIESSIIAVMEKKNLTALERFRELILASSDVSSRKQIMMAYFHHERNQLAHLAIENRSRAFMVPVMERIIVQGNEEGVFHADHPHETAVTLVTMVGVIRHDHPYPLSQDEAVHLTEVMQDLAERLLVMEKGSFVILQDMMPPALRERAMRTRQSKKGC